MNITKYLTQAGGYSVTTASMTSSFGLAVQEVTRRFNIEGLFSLAGLDYLLKAMGPEDVRICPVYDVKRSANEVCRYDLVTVHGTPFMGVSYSGEQGYLEPKFVLFSVEIAAILARALTAFSLTQSIAALGPSPALSQRGVAEFFLEDSAVELVDGGFFRVPDLYQVLNQEELFARHPAYTMVNRQVQRILRIEKWLSGNSRKCLAVLADESVAIVESLNILFYLKGLPSAFQLDALQAKYGRASTWKALFCVEGVSGVSTPSVMVEQVVPDLAVAITWAMPFDTNEQAHAFYTAHCTPQPGVYTG